MISAIRDVEAALGDGRKVPARQRNCRTASWRAGASSQRAAFVSGERFTEDNLGVKRPGDGVPPIEYWSYLGKTAQRDYAANEALDP